MFETKWKSWGVSILGISCHYLYHSIYCNLDIYGLHITTGQDIFEPVLAKQANDHSNG